MPKPLTQEQMDEVLEIVGDLLAHETDQKVAPFALLVFPPGVFDGRIGDGNYISNTNHEDVIAELRRTADYLERQLKETVQVATKEAAGATKH
jgi:hypothetical protein